MVSLTFNNFVDFSASGGKVALAASTFRLAKMSWALVFFTTLSAVTAIFSTCSFAKFRQAQIQYCPTTASSCWLSGALAEGNR
jgi:hypothetical protein